MQTPRISLLLRDRGRGLGMTGRVAVVAETSLGTNASSQSTLLVKKGFNDKEMGHCVLSS